MTNKCQNPCKRESQQFDQRSHGILCDDEKICRFGYSIHYDKKGALKKSIIQRKGLLSGELSVWRFKKEYNNTDLEQIVKIGIEREPKIEGEIRKLQGLYGIDVIEIRKMTYKDGRLFCIIDDCKTNGDGNFHPDHCVIRFCEEHFGKNFKLDEKSDEDDTQYRQLRDLLFKKFDANRIDISSLI